MWARINREKRNSNRSVWVGVGLLGNDQETQVMAVGITCLGHSLVLQLQQGANDRCVHGDSKVSASSSSRYFNTINPTFARKARGFLNDADSSCPHLRACGTAKRQMMFIIILYCRDHLKW